MSIKGLQFSFADILCRLLPRLNELHPPSSQSPKPTQTRPHHHVIVVQPAQQSPTKFEIHAKKPSTFCHSYVFTARLFSFENGSWYMKHIQKTALCPAPPLRRQLCSNNKSSDMNTKSKQEQCSLASYLAAST